MVTCKCHAVFNNINSNILDTMSEAKDLHIINTQINKYKA